MKRIFLLILLLSQLTVNAQETGELLYTLYVIGDAGKITSGQTNNFRIAKHQMAVTEGNAGLIFLGDNIYPQGMPPLGHPARSQSEKVIDAHIDLVKDFNGAYFFIPGNHDWAQGRSFGWRNVLNQERYVESHLNNADVFLPSGGCPGPVEIPLNEEITLIIIDTQWFLHPWSKPDAEQGGCDYTSPDEVILRLKDIMDKNAHKRIVVATHHPMYTYGEHGGVTKFSSHLIPPILGSVYPLYRKAIGSVQDLSNPIYKSMRNAMIGIFESHPNTIHVAGHEHSLQYSYKDSVHYIVSGAGAKKTYVKKKGFAEYAESSNGFSKLLFYKNGRTVVEFWREDSTMTFTKVLFDKPYQSYTDSNIPSHELIDSTVMVSASRRYKTTKLKKKLFGNNYRDVWQAKIKVPVFDISNEHGGLTVVQRGGGQQTKSLRLQASDGKQYVLRSIEKYAEKAVPVPFRNTFAEDLVQDQISASHPYGAMVVADLAEAAGIYHTNPKLVYIPDDPHLGRYRKEFANTLALYEERPAHDWSDADFFGNSSDIESTSKVLSELVEDNDNEVDQRFVLKSRLFDLIIGDWDRHDDQWRWSEHDKEDKGKIYRPIPRDRDQAFFINEGFFPNIWSRKWGLPKFEGFDSDVRWAPGFMYNARFFDRSFLSELSRDDWLEIAQQLQMALTDEKIQEAIEKWPADIYNLGGAQIITKIKARRDHLKDYAIRYYLFLSKNVNVIGSNKKEYFTADRLENGDVHVIVRKIDKDEDLQQTLYDRLFKYNETKEIRLYGLEGEDIFKIKGRAKKSIKIRVIGGEDMDELDDDSQVSGLGKKTIFYDTKQGNQLKFNHESKNNLSYNPEVNSYDRKGFRYNVVFPLITANYNQDDGIFLGGGFISTNHGFRKEPFKSRHRVLGSYAFKTASYNFSYNGTFTDVIGHWDLQADLDLNVPDFTNNFFGMGNESQFDQQITDSRNFRKPIDYYRLRFEEITSSVGLVRDIGAYGKIGFSHKMYSYEIEDFDSEDRFVEDYLRQNNLNFSDQNFLYTGGGISLTVDTRKNTYNPSSGIVWNSSLTSLFGINEFSDDFHQFHTSLSLYHSFKLPSRLTFAMRTGYGANIGDYPFFKGQIIGGKYFVRGFRKTRFYGDKSLYNNFELRLKLFDVQTYLFPAAMGIMVFHDIGRVWLEGEDSNKWHRGVGGGLWFTPFNMSVLSTEIGVSREETLFYVRLGFLF